MAIENQAAVRGAHRTHHHAASVGKGGVAADADTAAATGFSALLGAAADDSDVSETGLVGSIGPAGDALPGTALPAAARQAVGTDDSTGADAATLAAWAGLLQPAAMPLAPVAPGLQTTPATVNTHAAATPPLETAAGGGFAGPGASASTGTGTGTGVSTLAPAGAADAAPSRAGKGATRLLPADIAGSMRPAGGTVPAAAPAPTPFAADSLPTQGQAQAQAQVTGQPLPGNPVVTPTAANAATPLPGPANPLANPLANAAPPRPVAVPGQLAAGRAHSATVAADAAAALSTGAIAATSTDSATPAVRGASSTVSLGEGSQGRWAGVLSDIVRPMQAEAGAGGFAGGASQGHDRGRGSEGRGAEGAAAGVPVFAPAPATADTGFSAAPSFGGDARPAAAGGGMVMTPDEWLAATTAPLDARSLQTAELTVDTFGAPVDVRISLNGSEAQVAFQTDQADTRALLGGAVSDLQNLLQQEGLVLSGVSVGGSNAGQAGDAQGFHGDAGRGGSRAQGGDSARRMPDIAVSAPVSAGAARSAAASARGGLDLFA